MVGGTSAHCAGSVDAVDPINRHRQTHHQRWYYPDWKISQASADGLRYASGGQTKSNQIKSSTKQKEESYKTTNIEEEEGGGVRGGVRGEEEKYDNQTDITDRHSYTK